jgi:regulator of sigma E protease
LNTIEPALAAMGDLLSWIFGGYRFLQVLIGFSVIIFVHELGHFLAAKWMGVRVDRFAVGFFNRVCGWRRGEGFTFGSRPEYSADELKAKGYGETDYCLKILPFGGYVKMLGQDDIVINEETGEVKTSDDPRSFTNKPVWRRMIVVSAGVVFNILFALLAYVFVFLFMGQRVVTTELGLIEPGSPAAVAGLLPGDRVVSIDGEEVRSFTDVFTTVLLSEGPMRFRVERGGQVLDEELVVDPGSQEGSDALAGLAPSHDAVISENFVPASDGTGPRPLDRIQEIDGVPVTQPGPQIQIAYQRSNGEPIEFTVERVGEDGASETVTYEQRPILGFQPARHDAPTEAQVVDSRHLLGLCRRRSVLQVLPGSPAEAAGFQAGDVVVQWGTVANPMQSDVLDSIEANEGRKIPVIVEREGEERELHVTPRSRFSLFKQNRPMVGVVFGGEDRRAVVADVARGTPAAELAMPRGSEIVAIDGQPTGDWLRVNEAFQAAAGSTVTVRYRTAGDEVEGRMRVPSSIVNELELPPTVLIRSINGERSIRLESGKKTQLPSPYAVEALLEKHAGQTVEVEYIESIMSREMTTKKFAVREDNTDPWQLRVHYEPLRMLSLEPKSARIDAGGNPIRAVGMAFAQTGDVLEKMYRLVKGMFSPRSKVGVESVAGPVGIFELAIRQAESGFADLLFFLALISVNLAVINFLPFPVVDGGLMVFLILEAVRGKPLSIKVQVTTTLIGLALIVGVFLFVTLQDISRWWGGP